MISESESEHTEALELQMTWTINKRVYREMLTIFIPITCVYWSYNNISKKMS